MSTAAAAEPSTVRTVWRRTPAPAPLLLHGTCTTRAPATVEHAAAMSDGQIGPLLPCARKSRALASHAVGKNYRYFSGNYHFSDSQPEWYGIQKSGMVFLTLIPQPPGVRFIHRGRRLRYGKVHLQNAKSSRFAVKTAQKRPKFLRLAALAGSPLRTLRQ